MFLSLYRDAETAYSNNPSASEAHWFLKPVEGTEDVYNIESAKKRGFFLNDLALLWTDPNNPTCKWYMKQVNPGENVYTMQNVHSKTQNRPSFLGTISVLASLGIQRAVFTSDPTQSESHWHLNLA
jgi:hypothetical protein